MSNENHERELGAYETTVTALRSRLAQAETALQAVRNLVTDSEGVTGYHLNGDIAAWDEFEEIANLDTTLKNIRATLEGGPHE